ncbi:MAG: hypothetical protein FWF81_09340 [Defluviitaleaceae bacterium]|nr:hypothetical protein [Defluviitaleaceae bacterium]
MATKAIILYKRKIDTPSFDSILPKYFCLGDYDGMDIHPVPCGKNGEFINLRDINYDSDNIKDTLAQKYFIFRPEGCFRANKEIEFWCDDTEKLMTTSFLSLAQGSNKITPAELFEFERELDNVIAYFSVDLSEVVIFVKGETYKYCDDFLTELRYNSFEQTKIVYSYTIPSIPTHKLKLDENVLIKEYNEKLHKVSLSIASRCHEGQARNSQAFIAQLESDIGKALNHTSILGDYDIHVDIFDLNFGKLISLYRKGYILNHTHDIYQNTIYNCVTKIHVSTSTNEVVGTTAYTLAHDELKSEIEEAENWLKNESLNQLQKDISITLHKLLISLNHAFKTRLGRSVSVLLCPHIKLFARLYYKYSGSLDSTIHGYTEDIREVNVFLKSLFTIMSATNNATLDFFQGQSVEINIYNTPIRLLLFYAGFINTVKAVLRDDEKTEYQFLLLSEIATQIDTKPLFYNIRELDDDALVLISATEKNLYSNDFLLSLTHEIAHTVGNKTRCRELRGDLFFGFLISVAIESLLKAAGGRFDFHKDELSEIYKISENVLKQETTALAADLEKTGNYSNHQIQYYHEMLLLPVIAHKFEAIVEPIMYSISKKLFNMQLDKLQKLHDHGTDKGVIEKTRGKITATDARFSILERVRVEFNKAKLIFLDKTAYEGGDVYIDTRWISPTREVAEHFRWMSQEVYADLISVLTLRPPIVTYVKMLNQVDETLIYTTSFITRVKAVLYLLYTDSEYKTEWDKLFNSSLDFNKMDETGVHEDFARAVREICGVNEPKGTALEQQYDSKGTWYRNSIRFDSVLHEYVTHCYAEYVSKISSGSIKPLHDKLRAAYAIINNSPNIIAGMFAPEMKI